MSSSFSMKPYSHAAIGLGLVASASLLLSGCKAKEQGSGAPPPAQVIQVNDMNLITIDKNDVPKFPLTPAGQVDSASKLNAWSTKQSALSAASIYS